MPPPPAPFSDIDDVAEDEEIIEEEEVMPHDLTGIEGEEEEDEVDEEDEEPLGMFCPPIPLKLNTFPIPPCMKQ